MVHIILKIMHDLVLFYAVLKKVVDSYCCVIISFSLLSSSPFLVFFFRFIFFKKSEEVDTLWNMSLDLLVVTS